MFTSLFIIAISGLITGFVLTIPVAGPVSIYITSQGLKGRVSYCTFVAIGAAVVDFIYCFAAVYGLTQLYQSYYPLIPYVLLIGGLSVSYIGIRVFRKSLPVDLNPSAEVGEKIRHHNAFITGFMLNFLNPTLFFGWFISSLAVLSFIASLGVDVGGIDHQLRDNLSVIEQYEHSKIPHTELRSYNDTTTATIQPSSNGSRFALWVSITFAFTLALGTVIWFYIYSLLLKKNRLLFNPVTLTHVIRLLGFAMTGLGLFIIFKALMNLL